MKKLVAVYGSLRKGLGNHRLLEHVPMIAEGVVQDSFDMYSLGGFPALVESEDNSMQIVAEVYDVDPATFSRLDCLEGYPSFYDRKEVTVVTNEGVELSCWIYYLHKVPAYNNGLVGNNDWYKYIMNSRSE